MALLSLGLLRAHAAEPFDFSLRDYVHTAWTQHDGIALSNVRDITQTTDGYLWVITGEEGLLRFDGVRFVAEASPCGRPATYAESDGRGGLWLICDNRLFHRDASGRAVAVEQSLLPPTFHPALHPFVDGRQRVWLWGNSLGYLTAEFSQSSPIAGTERPRHAMYGAMAEDAEGAIWFATPDGLMRIRDNVAEKITGRQAMTLGASRGGGVFGVLEGSIVHMRGGAISVVARLSPDVRPITTKGLVETEHGIWLATLTHGAALVRNGRVELFGQNEGLSSDTASVVFADREGAIWVGTSFGLHRFRRPLAGFLSRADGVPSGMPHVVFHDRHDRLWISVTPRTIRIGEPRLAVEEAFSAMGEDRHGRLWAATSEALGYLQNDRFVPVPDARGVPIAEVYALQLDPAGDLWAVSVNHGLYRIVQNRPILEIASSDLQADVLFAAGGDLWCVLSGGRLLRRRDGVDTIVAENGLAGRAIYALHENGDSLWAAGRNGLARLRNGVWTTWTRDAGLPGQGEVFEVTTDAQGRVWVMSDAGILAIDRAQLDQTPDGKPRRLAYLRIGSLDRIRPHRGGFQPSPRISRDREGRLYFATTESVAIVDPARLDEASFKPPIVLESVLVNRRRVAASAAPRFVSPDDVEFEYTSLSLRNPENVRFRHRLEGRDGDWVESGTQRRVAYTNLRPGRYRFRVIGSGSEGVWNETGASYEFDIVAPFYRTPLFYVAVAFLIATIIWTVYRYQVRLAAERVRLKLMAQADERLRIAQDMHDRFLQGVQSSALVIHAAAGELEREPATARRLLDRALEMVSQSVKDARQTLSSLRADPAPAPLPDRLEHIVRREASLYDNPPTVSVHTSGRARDLHPPVDEDVCRIAAEALQNALRHAQATTIRLELEFHSRQFELRVADDGIGIEREVQEFGRDGHFGLRGMRERAERHGARLRIESHKGRGTELHLSLAGKTAYRSPPIPR